MTEEIVSRCPECSSDQIYVIPPIGQVGGWPQMECVRCMCTFYDDGEVVKHGVSHYAQEQVVDEDDEC